MSERDAEIDRMKGRIAFDTMKWLLLGLARKNVVDEVVYRYIEFGFGSRYSDNEMLAKETRTGVRAGARRGPAGAAGRSAPQRGRDRITGGEPGQRPRRPGRLERGVMGGSDLNQVEPLLDAGQACVHPIHANGLLCELNLHMREIRLDVTHARGQIGHALIEPVDLLVDPAEIAQDEAVRFVAHVPNMATAAPRVHRGPRRPQAGVGSGFGETQPLFDPVEPIVDAIEPTADLGAELGAIALDMGQMPLSGGQPRALFALLGMQFGNVGADRPQKLRHRIVGRFGHARNMAVPGRGVHRHGVARAICG